MIAQVYKSLRNTISDLNERERGSGFGGRIVYNLTEGLLSFLGFLITAPFFISLGSYRSFLMFARQRSDQTWIDSYGEFVRRSRITAAGLIALIAIVLFNLIVFYFTPVIILWLKTAFGFLASPFHGSWGQ